MSLVMEEGTHDNVIIQEETEELKLICDKSNEKKKELILQAAEKLAGKYQDRSVISSKLKKAWSEINISSTYIMECLPAEYKREYTKPLKVRPGEAEAFFIELAGVMREISKTCEVYAAKIKDAQIDGQIQEMLLDIHECHKNASRAMLILKERMSEIRHFKDLFKFLSELKAEARAVAGMTSERQKFTASWKLALQVLTIWKSYDHIASQIVDSKKHGAKWVSRITHDEQTKKLYGMVKCCPACGWDWQVWMEQAMALQRKGSEKIPKIK